MAGPGQDHAFAREEVFPSWLANRFQDMLSAGKFDLVLSRKNATTIQVVPDAILGIAAVNIKGRWRFNTAAVERVVTGAKATYGIWAVAEDNSINNTPNPFTDHTVYTFELRVSVAEPAVGAGTAIAMKIGEVDWSGTEIETIRQNRGAVTGAQIADGALSSAGSAIEWTREANGALVPVVKAAAIAESNLNAALQAKLGLTATKTKTANQALNAESILPQEITELSVPVSASSTERWWIEYNLIIETNAVGDFKITFAGPAGATLIWGGVGTWTNTSTASEAAEPLAINSELAIGGRTGPLVVEFKGMLLGGGTAGNLLVKGSLKTSTAVTPKVMAGSTVVARKMAV